MIRVKSKLFDTHIAAIGEILANSSDPESRLKSFFYLVDIDYVVGDLACCVLRLIDNGGTVDDIKEVIRNNKAQLAFDISTILAELGKIDKLGKIRSIL